MNTNQSQTVKLSPIEATKAGFRHFGGSRWWGYGLLMLIADGTSFLLIGGPTIETATTTLAGFTASAVLGALFTGIVALYAVKAALAEIPPRDARSSGNEDRSCFATAALITLILAIATNYGQAALDGVMPVWRFSIAGQEFFMQSSVYALLLITTLTAPLVMMTTLYNTSGYSIGESFRRAFTTGTTHYLPLLGLSALMHLIIIIGAFILIIGWIIAPAIVLLSVTDAYRQLGGAAVQEESHIPAF